MIEVNPNAYVEGKKSKRSIDLLHRGASKIIAHKPVIKVGHNG